MFPLLLSLSKDKLYTDPSSLPDNFMNWCISSNSKMTFDLQAIILIYNAHKELNTSAQQSKYNYPNTWLTGLDIS